jgi:hypothetical protein
MTSINQTSSGDKANLVSSSLELLTRPASKPDDRSNSSRGELRTLVGILAYAASSSKVAAAGRRWSPVAKFLPFPSARSASPRDTDFLLSNLHKSPDFLRDFEIFYFHFNSRSAAETALRFAETSQQTLRQISPLPTTYINFAGKNALKSKKLRQLRLGPNVDSNFVAKMAAASRRWSPVAKFLPFPRCRPRFQSTRPLLLGEKLKMKACFHSTFMNPLIIGLYRSLSALKFRAHSSTSSFSFHIIGKRCSKCSDHSAL